MPARASAPFCDPHRDATLAWTLAHERGYDEIVARIEEEEDRRRAMEKEPAMTTGPTFGDIDRNAVADGDLEWLRARQRKESCQIMFAGRMGACLPSQCGAAVSRFWSFCLILQK